MKKKLGKINKNIYRVNQYVEFNKICIFCEFIMKVGVKNKNEISKDYMHSL